MTEKTYTARAQELTAKLKADLHESNTGFMQDLCGFVAIVGFVTMVCMYLPSLAG